MDPAAATLDLVTGEFGRVAVGGQYLSRGGHVALVTNVVSGRDELLGGLLKGWSAQLTDLGDMRESGTLFSAFPALRAGTGGLVVDSPQRYGRDPLANVIVPTRTSSITDGIVRADVQPGHIYHLETSDGTQRVSAVLRVIVHVPGQEVLLQWRLVN